MAASIHALNSSATRIQIAHQITGKLLRSDDFDVHHRFQNNRAALFHRGPERLAAGQFEGQFVGVNIVIRTVDQLDTEIDNWRSSKRTKCRGLENSLFNCRAEVLRNSSSKNLVDPFK